jgi:hypothetical protein
MVNSVILATMLSHFICKLFYYSELSYFNYIVQSFYDFISYFDIVNSFIFATVNSTILATMLNLS